MTTTAPAHPAPHPLDALLLALIYASRHPAPQPASRTVMGGVEVRVGDRVTIADGGPLPAYTGLTGEVIALDGRGIPIPGVRIRPDRPRPGGSRAPFWWDADKVVKLQPVPPVEPEVTDVATVEGLEALDVGTVLRAGSSGTRLSGCGELWAVCVGDGADRSVLVAPLERHFPALTPSRFIEGFGRGEILFAPNAL